MEHERRHLTVVFCDLVGSTELSTAIDPEEFSDLVQAYQQRAVSIARRFGGDVEAYSGDGITFRFGWPEAHDDDAERALRAALEILASIDDLDGQHRLMLRIGVHSGLAIVGEMGGQGRRATMALGETMNLAARLQGVAPPGGAVTSSATLALVKGLFHVESLGAHSLKGIAQPVEAFQVVRVMDVRSRLEASGGGLTAFVGRDAEITLLTDRWDGVLAGRGAAVLISGEPGVGKSRVAYQVHHMVADHEHTWIECCCSPYTQMSVLWPVVQMIEQELGIRGEEDARRRFEALQTSLSAAGIDTPDAEGLVAALLGIPGAPVPLMSVERRLERTIEVLVAWVVALARLQPLILLIEDLQWSDPTSLDVLDRLLEQVPRTSLFLLMTARPEFVGQWTDGDVVTRLRLQPLPEDDIRRLVNTLGGDRLLPGSVVDHIVDSASGIPLFAEEVGRGLFESGVLVADGREWELASDWNALEIPHTLQSSLLARLDRLGEAKGVAQVAAVIGRDFRLDLLAEASGIEPAVLEGLVERLVHSAILVEQGAGKEKSYLFRHILLQETAYESLLYRTRRTLHQRVADLLRDRLDTETTVAPEAIARHYEAAGEIEGAADYYHRAAGQAAEGSGYREAIFFLRHAISLVNQPSEIARRDELEIEMQLSLGSAIMATKSYADPEIEKVYGRARELCEQLGNDGSVGLALAGLSIYYINRGDTVAGAELAERVLTIASKQNDDTLELLGRVQLALARNFLGAASECLDHALRALEIYDPDRHADIARRFGTDHGVAAHAFAAWGYLTQGFLDQGLQHMDQGVSLAEALGQPFNLAYALFFRSTAHWERGEYAATLRDARHARQLGEEQGFEWWVAVGGLWEAAARIVEEGEVSAATELLEFATVAEASGNRAGSTTVLALVSEAMRAAGDLDTAMAFADLALAASVETSQPWYNAAVHGMRAELLVAQAERDKGGRFGNNEKLLEAEREWLEALQLADQQGYPLHGLRAASGYAGYLRDRGRIDEALRLLDERYHRCPEGFTTPVLLDAKAALMDLERMAAADPA